MREGRERGERERGREGRATNLMENESKFVVIAFWANIYEPENWLQSRVCANYYLTLGQRWEGEGNTRRFYCRTIKSLSSAGEDAHIEPLRHVAMCSDKPRRCKGIKQAKESQRRGRQQRERGRGRFCLDTPSI